MMKNGMEQNAEKNAKNNIKYNIKSERILHCLSEVNGAYIEEADPTKKESPVRRFIPAAVSAAVLCMLLGGAVCYRLENPYRRVKVFVEAGADDAYYSQGAYLPRWEEMEIYEQYYRVEYDGNSYTSRSAVLPADSTGEPLGSVTAEGWDEYAALAGEEAERSMEAQLCSIRDVSAECAVGVRYEGREETYVFVNSFYRPETLGQFIDDMNLRENVIFGTVSYEYVKPLSGDYATVLFDDVDGDVIWEMLLSETEAENQYDDVEILMNYPRKLMDISVSIPLSGNRNISLSVHEGGYIITNILDTGKMFYVGEENTEGFVDYVLKECDGYEQVYMYGEAGDYLLKYRKFVDISAEWEYNNARQVYDGRTSVPVYISSCSNCERKEVAGYGRKKDHKTRGESGGSSRG